MEMQVKMLEIFFLLFNIYFIIKECKYLYYYHNKKEYASSIMVLMLGILF